MSYVRILCIPALLMLLWPARAQAQPKAPTTPTAPPPATPATPPPAKSTWPGYDLALDEMAQKNFAAACPRLEEVVRMAPNEPLPLSTLGECNEGWGRLATAYGLYRRAEQAAVAKGDQEQSKKAQAKITELEPRLSRLTLEVPQDVAATPGVVVNFDRQPLDRQLWGAPLFVDRGEHSLEVLVPGRSPWVRKVPVETDGESYLVKVNIKVQPPNAGQNPYPPPPMGQLPYPPGGAWWTQPPQDKPAPAPPPVKNAQNDKRFSVRAAGGAAFFMSSFPYFIDVGGFTELDVLYRLRIKPKVRIDMGLKGRYYGNVDASHWKVGVPFEFVFELGRYVELPVVIVPGGTFIVFDDPHFDGANAFDMQIQVGLQFVVSPLITIGVSPFSFDFVMPKSLGDNLITYEPRAWVGASF